MRASFWQFFRLIFVIFSLFLLGDAFYRWDGFRYYASFTEFLPSVSLAFMLWSIVSIITTVLLWILLKIFLRLCRTINLKVNIEHILSGAVFSLIIGVVIWAGKKLVMPDFQTSSQSKIGVVMFVAALSILLAWILRKKAKQWIELIQERITPLVWLFGIFVILSIPLLGYFALSNIKEAAGQESVEQQGLQGGRPNIILVTFDALTAKDMSVYGYERNTTPFISEWANSASVFTRHESSGNYTAPTTATLMTGKRIWTHRRFQSHAGAPVKSKTESLPFLLAENGYYNMAFVANRLASVHDLGMVNSFKIAPIPNEFVSPQSIYGFIRYYLYKLVGSKIRLSEWILNEDFILYRLTPDTYFKHPLETEFPAEKTFDMFFDYDKKQVPYFAWIHLHPPHAPYLPPDEYAGLFDSSQKFRQWKDQYSLIRQRYFTKDQQLDADIVRARYDEFIRYCDREFQRFIEILDEKGQLQNTVIILSSDHGESFEHGYFTHGGPYLFEEMTHLPLVIKEAGQIQGKIIETIIDQVDVPATILDLAGIPAPSWMEGRSIMPLLEGKELEPKPVFSMNFDHNPSAEKITKGTIAVWEGDYKLIHYLEKDLSLLFNLKNDPAEMNNLIYKDPETGQRLLGLIRNNLEKVNEDFSEGR